jgi:recombination protein RecT
MTNEIKVAEEKVIGEFTQNQLNVLQHTIAKDTNLAQFDLFVQTCVNSGLNPFLNHIYCIVYGGQMSIQIAVEGILHLARQKEGYKGIDTQLVHEKDDFKLGRNEQGEMKVLVHDIPLPRGKVIGGYAIAKREGFEDVIVVMEVSEVEEFIKGRNAKMWKSYFSDMFKKHMVKRAAKMQFGIEINEDESFAGSSEGIDGMDGYEPLRKEINEDIQATETKIVTDEEEPAKSEEELFKEQWDIIAKHSKTYDLKKKEINAIVKDKFNKKATELSLQQVAALIKFVEIEGKNKGAVIDVEDQPLDPIKEPEKEPEKEVKEEPKTEVIDKKQSIVDPAFEEEMGSLFG